MAKGIYVGVSKDSLITNGDFSNGLEGWTQGTFSDGTKLYTATIESDSEGNYVKVVHTEAYTSNNEFYIRSTNFPTYINHVYYICGKVKHGVNNASSANAGLGAGNTDTGYSVRGLWSNTEWQFISTRFTRTKDVANDTLNLTISLRKETSGSEYYYRDVKEYDLTEMFGTGNEPTQQWCDNNLTTLENLYKSKNSKARKVKKAYIGVSDKARKVKKGYIGVGGVARLFYSAETLVPFTSSPAPTTGWTDSSDNKSATATNQYGEWSLSASITLSSSYKTSYAVDSSTSTAWANGTSSNTSLSWNTALYFDPPTGVTINPKKISVVYKYTGNSSDRSTKIQGYNGSAWVTLASLRVVGNTVTTSEYNIDVEEYYSRFRILAYPYSTSQRSNYIYDFKITSGTLKIE